mmetsp:Transcript_41008/g.101973  ORF Transcript_41008/g.101973 Transcript_41008/m.101973 type:complete len:441 (-) Transcript_41008:72-1394(-)
MCACFPPPASGSDTTPERAGAACARPQYAAAIGAADSSARGGRGGVGLGAEALRRPLRPAATVGVRRILCVVALRRLEQMLQPGDAAVRAAILLADGSEAAHAAETTEAAHATETAHPCAQPAAHAAAQHATEPAKAVAPAEAGHATDARQVAETGDAAAHPAHPVLVPERRQQRVSSAQVAVRLRVRVAEPASRVLHPKRRGRRALGAVPSHVHLHPRDLLLQLRRARAGRGGLEDLHEEANLLLHLHVVVTDLHLQTAEPRLQLRHAVADRVQVGGHLPRLCKLLHLRRRDSGAGAGGAAVLRLRLGLVAALDLRQLPGLVAPEAHVEELEVLVRGGDVGALAKAVGVELADEGANVIVLEVGGQNLAGERVRITDHERVALDRPLDAGIRRRRRHDLKEFREEGRHVRAADRLQVLDAVLVLAVLGPIARRDHHDGR